MKLSRPDSPRDLRIVLVRPRNPLNLLAAARAATNFGFQDIVVVAPHPPVWEEAGLVPAGKLWLRHARLAATLAEAIEDRKWILGTSCLARRRTVGLNRLISLDQVVPAAARVKRRDGIAILFGSEKRGLSNHDLELCHAIVRVPTSNEVPSMNLGQAVAVCCYELRNWSGGTGTKARLESSHTRAASAGEIARLVNVVEAVLGVAGDSARGKAKARKVRLRQMLMRWPVTNRDVNVVLGVLRDLSWQLRRSEVQLPRGGRDDVGRSSPVQIDDD